MLGVLGALGGWAFVMSGAYDVSATKPHWRPVYELLEVAMHRSVQQRGDATAVPEAALRDPQLQEIGASCFRAHCVACHGGPGVPPASFALGLQPVPRSLTDSARSLSPGELMWVTRHGIKMSGMPAWEYRLSEEQLLAVTAFVSERLPRLSVPGYRELTGQAVTACGPVEPAGSDKAQGVRARGELALRQHGCTACHAIPGVTGPDSGVGPSLDGFARRQLIAGRLTNTAVNLERWIRDPQAIDPNTAMPNLGVSERSAREMAQYLHQGRGQP
ncbi:c-type cytochrome [Roseateles agri]|uniref:c-type cytochrome n=1 Tax=Roseateles agri TaxID=3098619 RepID=UPI002A5A59AB|nr:c-type cytochrome [Paucibacter sp. R3-3]